MPLIVSDMDVLIEVGEASFDEDKGYYVNKDGEHLVSFLDVASGRFRAHPDEPLFDDDEPGFSVPTPDFDY